MLRSRKVIGTRAPCVIKQFKNLMKRNKARTPGARDQWKYQSNKNTMRTPGMEDKCNNQSSETSRTIGTSDKITYDVIPTTSKAVAKHVKFKLEKSKWQF